MIRNRRVEYSIIRSCARSFARITHSIACYALVALLPRSAALIRSLRCAHSLACFAFASMEISLEHTQYVWRKKLVSNFLFFSAFASMEVPLEDRQCQVRSYGQVNGKKIFFCFFSMARENRDICAFLKWTCLGSISIWIQNLKIYTMSQNRYYVPKLIECLKINGMSQD